jgi:hypothetical protein
MTHGKKTFCFIVACAALLACACSRDGSQVGSIGGSQVGNPATVVGCVDNSRNFPVPGAQVYLLPKLFNPALAAIDSSFDTAGAPMVHVDDSTAFVTRTDSSGAFTIRYVPQDAYNLFVRDDSGKVAIRRNIRINADMVDLGRDTVRQPGVVIIDIADTAFGPGGYLIVAGTPLNIKVSAPGQYLMHVPDDTVAISYVVGTTAKSTNIPGSISVVSGDTMDVTGIPAFVINGSLGYSLGGSTLPLTAADTIRIADSTVRFTMTGAYSNKGKGLAYQFFLFHDSSNTILTTWNTSATYDARLNAFGWYYVSCRVQCTSPAGVVVSEWLPTCAVMILALSNGSVSTPRVPVLVDTSTNADTLKAQFLTGGAVSSHGDAVWYRFQIQIDTFETAMGPWSPDSMTNFKFAPKPRFLYVSSQARSSFDTSLVSPWSPITDTLYFHY